MRLHVRIAPAMMVAVALLAATQGVCQTAAAAKLPRLLELGSVDCQACKQMAPIIEGLKQTHSACFNTEFIDVLKNLQAMTRYSIETIPTQLFLDPKGKELFRHVGFFSREDILAKWAELGVDVGVQAGPFSRWQPATPDNRPKDTICYMCDGDIDPRTKVTVATVKGNVNLASIHHFFIMISCLTADVAATEASATVADWATGSMVPIQAATYLCGFDEATGRPTIKAFADRASALAERAIAGGNLLDYATLKGKELSHRCGFCDRAVYPEDAALVKAGGVQTWGCCSHCALGVAARTGLDIEVYQPDGLTGEMVAVKTFQGKVASLEPPTAVAWFGQRTKPDGTHASAGCFHQGFFVSRDNLLRWVEAHPFETGEMITIDKALADKMALSPQQIQKACKIGECAPK